MNGKCLISFFIFLSLLPVSCRQSVEKKQQTVIQHGKDSLKQQISNRKDAEVDLTTILADNEDINAQLIIIEHYVYGRGAEQNFQIATEMLQDLVEIGIPEAEFYMGECCRLQGDYASAIGWYESSGGKGIAVAFNNLGNCYLMGLGVPADTTKALNCYKDAGMLGSISSQYNVGIFYAKGYGVNKNSEEAVRWLKMAADQNDEKKVREAAINALQEFYGIYMSENE